MDLDEDLLFDGERGPAAPKVRGRFQPKAKPRPRKETTNSISVSLPSNTNEETIVDSLSNLDTAQFVRPVDAGDSILKNAPSSSGTLLPTSEVKDSFTNTEVLRGSILFDDAKQSATTQNFLGSDAEQLDQPVNSHGENIRFRDPAGFPLSTSEIVGTVEGMKVDEGSVHFSDGRGDSCPNFEKAVGQSADLFSGLEFLDNFPSQLTDNTGENNIGAQNSLNSSLATVGDAPQAHPSDFFMTQHPVTCLEDPTYTDDGGIPIDDRRLETEHPEAFPNLETLCFTSEETTTSGGRAGKYKPKPKARTEKEKPSTSIPQPDAAESMTHQQGAQFVASETECMYDDSLPTYDEFDYSSLDLGDVPLYPNTSGDPINGEPENLAENSCEDTMTKNLKHMGTKRSVANNSTVTHEETKSGKSSRQQRKQAADSELADEPDDDAEPASYFLDDDEGNIDGDAARSTSQKKGAPGKAKKPANEKDKPVRKRAKTNEASEQSIKEPPKKFSHSTRRKRRRVNKELLETPEHEIDPQRVPIRDLILLAEYKERLASKEAKTSTTPSTNQRTENSFGEEDYNNEEDAFGSEQGSWTFANQAPRRIQSGSLVFNYGSFMNKTQKRSWSKQDTELFYEGIRQFGTDLSMIQQLFPGTTRHQIKLKYKKEERQHPLRLSEALTNRATDHSHFEKVIQKLQEAAAESRRKAKEDDCPVDSSAEEDEEIEKDKQDEAEKVEEDEDVAVEGREANVAEETSPPKADEGDDEINFDDYNFDY